MYWLTAWIVAIQFWSWQRKTCNICPIIFLQLIWILGQLVQSSNRVSLDSSACWGPASDDVKREKWIKVLLTYSTAPLFPMDLKPRIWILRSAPLFGWQSGLKWTQVSRPGRGPSISVDLLLPIPSSLISPEHTLNSCHDLHPCHQLGGWEPRPWCLRSHKYLCNHQTFILAAPLHVSLLPWQY